MDYDFCQQVKCGIIPPTSVRLDDLYACSVEFGAGVLYPCHDDCLQYGQCFGQVNVPIPLMGPTAVVLEGMNPPMPTYPLLFNEVIPPYPEIYQIPLVSSSPCVGWWEDLNAGIRESPVCALLLLAGSLVVLRAVRGNK